MGDYPSAPPPLPTDSKGLKDYLSTWQKNQLPRAEREMRAQRVRNGLDLNLGSDAYQAANDYEDKLNNLIQTTTANEIKANAPAEEAARLRAATASTAQRDQDLKRKQALEGQRTSQESTLSSPGFMGANTILSTPLGQSGGYLANAKTILGS